VVYGDLLYGEACVYGGDLPCVVPPPTPTEADCDDCGEGWRVEATHLYSGIVKAVLQPISSDWDDAYTAPGEGTLTVSTLEPSAFDTWAHTTGVYISRVNADGTRESHFGGYIEQVGAAGAGQTTIGLKSMDEFPFHRLLTNADEGIGYATPGYVSPETPGDGLSQTQIAADLLAIALDGLGSVPLSVIAEESTQMRVRSWLPSDFKNIGEAIKELIDVPDGLRYRLEHVFFENPARWVTRIRLTDEESTDRGVNIRADREAWQYGIDMDAKDQASRVFGVGGAGEGENLMFSVAYDEDAGLPEFQATVAFKDVTIPEVLDEQTRGEVTKRRDPAVTPTATLIGLTDVPPERLLSGEIISADIGYGVFTFRGEKARVASQSWRLEPGQPVTRVLELDPIIRPSLSVKTQTPAVAPPEEALTPEQGENTPPQTPITPPPAAAGLVTTVKVGSLTEISGMQWMGDGNVWVHNDENNTPQVIAVSLATGAEAGNVNVPAPSRHDPEAIRRHPNGTGWVGDIGENDNRSSVRLYQVGGSVVHTLTYPFGPSNAEALLIHPVSGEFFIADKAGRVVSFGTGPSSSGSQVASGLPGNISDGTFTNDGKYALFTVAGVSVVYVHAYPGWQQVGQIAIPSLSKCEAITVDSDCSFLVTSEGANAPIYRVLIPTAFGGCA
jgi:hypothetical protein